MTPEPTQQHASFAQNPSTPAEAQLEPHLGQTLSHGYYMKDSIRRQPHNRCHKKSNRMDFVQIATGGTWSFVFQFLFLSERFCLFHFVVVLVSFDWDVFISALSELQLQYNAHRERSANFELRRTLMV